VETARRSGLSRQLSKRLGPWRRPRATHDPAKIMLDLAVLGAQPGVFGPVASDPTVSRLIATLAEDVDATLGAITAARATARERVWSWAGAPVQDGRVMVDPCGVPEHSPRC